MNEENMENGNSKKSKKGIVIGCSIGILLLLVICIGGFLLWNSSQLKPKSVFTTAIKNVYDRSKVETNQLKNGLMGNQFTISTDLKSDDKEVNDILSILNKMNITVDLKADANEKRMQMNLSSTYNQKDLLNAKFNVIQNVGYIDLNTLYNKTLSVPVEAESFFELFSKAKDLDIVFDNIIHAFEDSLKDEYFTKEKTTITIKNKEVKANKSTLLLNEENTKNILKSIGTTLNNDSFLTALANVSGMKEADIKEIIEELINDSEDITIEDNTTISIYTYGLKNEFAGIIFKDSTDSISILKTDDFTYTYKIEVENTNYTGTITYQEEKDTINCSITLDIEGISGTINLKTTSYDSIRMDGIDLNNTVSVEQLSETDQMTILENLQKQEGLVELIEAFQKLDILSF